jgi:GNAT superfamily N-acetyltransferase
MLLVADPTVHQRLRKASFARSRTFGDAAQLAGIAAPNHLETPTTYAIFAGPGSPLTQARGQFTEQDLTEIQSFYRGRTGHWEAVADPFIETDNFNRLLASGATVMNWESILVADPKTCPPQALDPEIEVTEAVGDNVATWAEVAREGFFGPNPDPMLLQLDQILRSLPNTRRYLALVNKKPAAAATLSVTEGVASLGGAATLPDFRGKGIQTALMAIRIQDAAKESDLIMMEATAGTSSHRNAERAGLRVAWSQLCLSVPTAP